MAYGYMDLVEDVGSELGPVVAYSISKPKGSPGEAVQLTIADVSAIETNSEITFKGMTIFVTSRDISAGPDGYQTVIKGVTLINEIVRKCPTKTLMFMSMTQAEKDDFEIANTLNGQLIYDKLDFTPMIKICRDDDFTGGWNCRDVIGYLAGLIDLDVVCNVRNYWLKQVQADVGSPIYETIVGLVSFMQPVVYIDAGTLFILNKPIKNGTASIDKIQAFTEVETFNYDSNVTYLKVQGGLGKFDLSKQKGKVQAEKEVTLTTHSEAESDQYMTVRMTGPTETIKRIAGKADEVTQGTGTREYTVKMTGPKVDTVDREEVCLLDPFGNVKAILATREVCWTANPILPGQPWKVSESSTEYEYDFLGPAFDKPRKKRSIQNMSRWAWDITLFPTGASKKFREKVDVIEQTYVYGENGILLMELQTRETDVLRLLSSGYFSDVTYVELDAAGMLWMEDSMIIRMIVEETETRYRQLTEDTYEIATMRRTPDGIRCKQNDEIRKHETKIVRGRVPRHPVSCRKGQVYAEIKPAPGGVMDVPAKIVSNPNIIHWADAEAILQDVREDVMDVEKTISRRLTIPGDVDVDLGWIVSFPAVRVGVGKEVPSREVVKAEIVAYTKTKEAGGPAMMTLIDIEAKVPVA